MYSTANMIYQPRSTGLVVEIGIDVVKHIVTLAGLRVYTRMADADGTNMVKDNVMMTGPRSSKRVVLASGTNVTGCTVSTTVLHSSTPKASMFGTATVVAIATMTDRR